MPIQATIPITPGTGLFLDAVSVTIGPNAVLREITTLGDPSNATQLATVNAGGALNVSDTILEACITANVLAVSLPTAQISTLTPPSASAIAAAIVANPPTVGISGSVPVTGTVAVTQSTSPWVVSNSGTFAVQATLSAETTKVIGTVNISAAQKIEIYDGTNTATVKAASTAAAATDTALVVAVSPNNTIPVTAPTSSTASSPASTSVGASSGSILASNTARKEVIVVNTGTTILYLGLGQTPSATAYHITLSPCATANDGTGGSWISDLWKGAVNAIGSGAGGSCVVTELT